MPASAPADLTLWYTSPAKDWESEALPLGNGRLGMMAFGGLQEDRFSLNEITIWAAPEAPARRDLSGPLKRSRELLAQGKEREAQELLQKEFMGQEAIGRYQPLGDLLLKFSPSPFAGTIGEWRGPATPAPGAGEVGSYRRELELGRALHTLRYEAGGVKFQRRAFVSAADDVMVVELAADKPGGVSLEIALEREENFQVEAKGQGMRFWGQAGDRAKPRGVSFEARLEARAKGGSVVAEGKLLKVEGADSLLILVAVATDYQPLDPLKAKAAGWERASQAGLDKVRGKEMEALLRAHVAEHQKYFSRMALDLGGAADELPTDERLERYRKGAEDPGLEALYFQFGRYLLLGTSRGGPLPANLQGLWNKHLDPPWSADYHININLQMNYWPAEAGGLQECSLPLFQYLEAMRPSARQVAKDLGLPGITAGHTGGAFSLGPPSGRTQWGLWFTGLAWCARHFMEHYRYGGDEVFLRERAWPFVKECAEFLLAWLVEDKATGKLVSGPASSPENEFLGEGGAKVNVSMGPSMDQEIAWDLFGSVAEAAAALGIEDAFVGQVKAAQAKLAWPGVGKDGRLLEWAQEKAEAEPGHRHISHLYGLHPGHQFSEKGTPELWAAARRSLEFRLSHGGGHTGWSRAWIMNFWARLHDGEKAHENFRQLLSKSTLANLWDTHPPFQIDGNFGGSAAVMEMLLQSQHGELELLPALPRAWAKGSVRGLRARGGYSVDMSWEKGRLREAKVTASKDGDCVLSCSGKRARKRLAAGESWVYRLEEGS